MISKSLKFFKFNNQGGGGRAGHGQSGWQADVGIEMGKGEARAEGSGG